MRTDKGNNGIPNYNSLYSSLNWTIISLCTTLAVSSCKSTNPKNATVLKSAEETQGEIKLEINDLLLNPAKKLFILLEPIASQFKSIQQIKAAADGVLSQAESWATRFPVTGLRVETSSAIA